MCEDGEVKYLVVATPDVGDLSEVRQYIPFVHEEQPRDLHKATFFTLELDGLHNPN